MHPSALLVLWTPTATRYLVARRELQREVKVPRVDVGAAFAEHAVALTDLSVRLAVPNVQGGVPVRDLPFRWQVTEDTRLPWREPADDGRLRDRVLLPDAVQEVSSTRRRVFIECETGTHTLIPASRDPHGARQYRRVDPNHSLPLRRPEVFRTRRSKARPSWPVPPTIQQG